MLKILKHFFKFLFINPDKLEKIHKKILSVIGAEQMNNYEKIKAMTLDEMAAFIAENINCGSCCLTDMACPVDLECDEFVKQWLQQESEE